MMRIRRSSCEALEGTDAAGALAAREAPLAEGYERWFGLVYDYVSCYVAVRPVRERIARQVLAENLDLLVGRREESVERLRLATTANRLIAEVADEADLVLD
jgi:hypothetical protein